MPRYSKDQNPAHKDRYRALKVVIALLILLSLIIFKQWFFSWEKDPSEELKESGQATQSADVASSDVPTLQVISAPSPAPAPAVPSPDPTTTPTSAPQIIGKLKILPTPTGFLNVRGGPSSSATIITKVSPGTVLSYSKEQAGWYQIILPNSQTGWVSSQYITINLSASPPIIRNSDNENRGEGE